MVMKLYSHWISSCSFRVRIALNIKGLPYQYQTVTTFSEPDFLKLSPVGFVPVLVDADSYLEDKYPNPPLLPRDIHKRAINFQATNIVSSSIQPLQNLTVVKYIGEKVGPDEKLPWTQSAIRKGFTALENLLKDHARRYATGDEIYLFNYKVNTDFRKIQGLALAIATNKHLLSIFADLFLAPQIDAAINRFKVDMKEFPTLSRLHETYNEIPAFREALPENQPDAVH